jgi:hypothetical protein
LETFQTEVAHTSRMQLKMDRACFIYIKSAENVFKHDVSRFEPQIGQSDKNNLSGHLGESPLFGRFMGPLIYLRQHFFLV